MLSLLSKRMFMLLSLEPCEGVSLTTSFTASPNAADALIPIIVLIAFVLIFDNDLIHGLLAAIAVQAVMYIGGFHEVFFRRRQVDVFACNRNLLCFYAERCQRTAGAF